MENTNRPVTVGIDFGGDVLRVATDREGLPSVIATASAPEILPRVFLFQSGGNEDIAGYRILSLKRILDFEEIIRSQFIETNTIDYVTQLFKNIREEDALKDSYGELHVLGAIPPCFSQRQRSALRTVLTDAGFSRAKLIDDSLAVLLGSLERIQQRNTILVYSWGASTFCASLYRQTDTGRFKPVIAPEGDRGLGGDDIDSAILAYISRTVSIPWKIDSDEQAQHLFSELRRVKLDMAGEEQAFFDTSSLGLQKNKEQGQGGEIRIPAAIFDDAVAAMADKTFSLVEKVLEGAGCQEPDAVLIAGGVTYIPEVGRRLEKRFPGRIVRAFENAVALGCVLQGRMLPPQEWETPGKRQEGLQGNCPEEKTETGSTDGHKMQADASFLKNGTQPWAEMLDIAPLLDRAAAAHTDGRMNETMESLREAHSRLGSLRCILYNKAASNLLSTGKPGLAFPLLQSANHCNPTNIGVAKQYAELCIKYIDYYLKKKKFREALEYTYKAVTAINNIPSAEHNHPCKLLAACFYREACIWSALGRAEEAETILIKCAELDPVEKRYANELGRLRKKKRKPGTSAGRKDAVAGGGTKVQRNEPCPCGSGKKYKHCCLKKRAN